MPRFAVLAVLAFVLAAAAPAGAAVPKPFTAGTGSQPTLTVDASGTGWVAWNQKIDGLTNKVVICRVPRGGSACAATSTVVPGDTGYAPPRIFVTGPNQLALITNRCCYGGPNRTQLYTSADGGATWSAPVLAGSLDTSGDAILGPGNAISVVTDTVTGGTNYQRVPLDGSPAPTTAAHIGADEYGGTIGFFSGRPVVAYYDFLAGGPYHLDFTAYSGTGDIADPSTWSAQAAIGPGSLPRLAGGTSGLFLLSKQNSVAVPTGWETRKFDGTTFGTPATIPGSTSGNRAGELTQDPSGRVLALWSDVNTLKGSTSTGGGAFSAARTFVSDEADFQGLEAQTAADGTGFAVWKAVDNIRVYPLALGGQGTLYTGPTRQTKDTVGDTLLTLTTPKSCVPPGSRIVARLRVAKARTKKRATGKGRLKVKVSRVNFLVDGKLKVADRKAAFSATLVIGALKPGSSHQVRAKIFLKVTHGPARSRSIRSTFKICAAN
jgi:hypothetical protein